MAPAALAPMIDQVVGHRRIKDFRHLPAHIPLGNTVLLISVTKPLGELPHFLVCEYWA